MKLVANLLSYVVIMLARMRNFMIVCLLGVLAIRISRAQSVPHIVFILADDVGKLQFRCDCYPFHLSFKGTCELVSRCQKNKAEK